MGSSENKHSDDGVVAGWRAAAEKAGCSRTQIRRHAAQGLVRFTLDAAGRHVFQAADLLALRPGEDPAATREEADGEAGEARASADSGSLKPAESDGEVASKVFALLNADEALTEVVVKLAVEPQRVAALHEEWLRMKERDVSGPSVPRDIEEMRLALVERERAHKELAKSVCDADANLLSQVQSLRKKLDDDPLAGMGAEWVCACGARELVAVKVECTACGRESSWGWHPEEKKG